MNMNDLIDRLRVEGVESWVVLDVEMVGEEVGLRLEVVIERDGKPGVRKTVWSTDLDDALKDLDRWLGRLGL